MHSNSTRLSTGMHAEMQCTTSRNTSREGAFQSRHQFAMHAACISASSWSVVRVAGCIARLGPDTRPLARAVSAAFMRVMIAQLSGVTDLHLLAAIFGLTATTMFFGHLMEEGEGRKLPTFEIDSADGVGSRRDAFTAPPERKRDDEA